MIPTHEFIFTLDADGTIHTYSWGNDLHDEDRPSHWYKDEKIDIDAARALLGERRRLRQPAPIGVPSLDGYIDEAFHMLRDAGNRSPSAHWHGGPVRNCKDEATRLIKLARELIKADHATTPEWREELRRRARQHAGFDPEPPSNAPLGQASP